MEANQFSEAEEMLLSLKKEFEERNKRDTQEFCKIMLYLSDLFRLTGRKETRQILLKELRETLNQGGKPELVG